MIGCLGIESLKEFTDTILSIFNMNRHRYGFESCGVVTGYKPVALLEYLIK